MWHLVGVMLQHGALPTNYPDPDPDIGLPGVRFLTGQSGFLAICLVKNMMLNRTISCPVFSRP